MGENQHDRTTDLYLRLLCMTLPVITMLAGVVIGVAGLGHPVAATLVVGGGLAALAAWRRWAIALLVAGGVAAVPAVYLAVFGLIHGVPHMAIAGALIGVLAAPMLHMGLFWRVNRHHPRFSGQPCAQAEIGEFVTDQLRAPAPTDDDETQPPPGH